MATPRDGWSPHRVPRSWYLPLRAEPGRAGLVRWQVAHGTLSVPQAAAPIAFGLLGLQATGSARAGAAMVLVMTAAQITGAVPLSRAGRRLDAVRYLRGLLALRAVALLGIAGAVLLAAPLAVLLVLSAAAGVVNVAAYGLLRTLLNDVVPPARLPRALGIAATANEVAFATAPLLAALVGARSPVAALLVVAAIGAAPVVLLSARRPAVGTAVNEDASDTPDLPAAPDSRPSRAVLPWLFCALAGSAAVACVEVGAVSLALAEGLDPAGAFVFALTLCVGSVLGGVVVSVLNRRLPVRAVVVLLLTTAAASALVATSWHLAVVLVGAFGVGFCLPFLSTAYSLRVEDATPPAGRAEAFALLRTASSLGIVLVSGLIALAGLTAALRTAPVLLLAAVLLVVVPRSRRAG